MLSSAATTRASDLEGHLNFMAAMNAGLEKPETAPARSATYSHQQQQQQAGTEYRHQQMQQQQAGMAPTLG